jgi:hypothetical protein
MMFATEEAWADQRYGEKYGEKKLMSELMEYEKITGKNWADALMAFDSVSHNIEKFHKEMVLPLIRQTRSVTGSDDSEKMQALA